MGKAYETELIFQRYCLETATSVNGQGFNKVLWPTMLLKSRSKPDELIIGNFLSSAVWKAGPFLFVLVFEQVWTLTLVSLNFRNSLAAQFVSNCLFASTHGCW